jgi:hypothetical protein
MAEIELEAQNPSAADKAATRTQYNNEVQRQLFYTLLHIL